MFARFVSLEWIPSKPSNHAGKTSSSNRQKMDFDEQKQNEGNCKRRYEKAKLILEVESKTGQRYKEDIYSHVKYVKYNIYVTKHVRELLEQGFRNYTFKIFRGEIIGIYQAIRDAIG